MFHRHLLLTGASEQSKTLKMEDFSVSVSLFEISSLLTSITPVSLQSLPNKVIFSLISSLDSLTVYPSTEWNMAQPFDCSCKTPRCLKLINGAAHIAPSTLSTYFVNAHILRLKINQLRTLDEVAGEAEILKLEESGREVLERSK